MGQRLGTLVAGICLLAASGNALAQNANCPAGTNNLPPELGTWTARHPLTASASGMHAAPLEIGQAVDAQLQPTPNVRYIVRPEKPGGSVSYGGVMVFTVTRAGTYRVALGSGAWVDVLKDRKAIVSTGHGHGPDCSGIRKMVDFPLAPGRYTLQIAANGEAALPLMVARLP
ncbi:hypothetical protein WSK_3835 [Novosphingobium sp. Rr 2-17]|uniref:hypothetical protein n=1 Tax=Novosphingobium sp. Rr 2-17 TaxID=555793 RepID=UPI0002698C09|nr:hypothetical protein [Novosphingobium sp. Rr 2-17]EIZ77599.1 hypothetical protein WSK_3835 [Novosphingobium sp. Rr 2-17]